MQKIRLAILIAIVITSSSGLSMVYGQDSNIAIDPDSGHQITMAGQLIGFLTFIASGLYYALSGFTKKAVRALQGEKVPLDYRKIGKTALLGFVLGVGAFVASEYQGQIIHVTTLQEFMIQVGLNTTLILTVDRFLLGSYTKNKPNIKYGTSLDTGIITFEDDGTSLTVEGENDKEKTVSVKPITAEVPKLGPTGNWYQNNFTKHPEKGNTLPQGIDLWIKIDGVRNYVTAILKNSVGSVIQVDQSHALDEDNDIETTRLEMKNKDGSPLPKGKYTLQVNGDRGTGDSQGIKTDEFEIV